MKHKLLKYKDVKSLPVKFPTWTEEQVKAYEAHEGPYFTPDNYRIDFTWGWKSSPMNFEAREYFITHFFETMNGGEYREPAIPERFLTRDRVGNLLDTHVAYLRPQFKKHSMLNNRKKEKKTRDRVLRTRCATRQQTVQRLSASAFSNSC